MDFSGSEARTRSLDVRERQKNPSEEMKKMHELMTKEKQLLRDQKEIAAKLSALLHTARAETESNTRSLQAAVAVSLQPGQPKYNHRLQKEKELHEYRSLQDQIMQKDRDIQELRVEIQRLRQAELAASAARSPVGDVGQWLQYYGAPNFKATPNQRFLSCFGLRKQRPVPKTCSKDGSVHFATEKSVVISLRKGMLIA
eukprot:GDKI01026259.1.p1 GENE.GDKI01026259.1~~GDKI01026259.1.p1  ORF type:complete len:220 (+),score=41.52 GDKI01026259.1:64-660(+)